MAHKCNRKNCLMRKKERGEEECLYSYICPNYLPEQYAETGHSSNSSGPSPNSGCSTTSSKII